ncbi:MAG: hypothetical protein KAY46_26420 [Burkholderiaceae bacterium]|jgi:hypothetical protein|nr:hypothetical protein [Burkholderiaceae bacterium]
MDTAKKTASTVAKAPAAKKPATSARTPSKNAPKAGRITQTKPTLADDWQIFERVDAAPAAE